VVGHLEVDVDDGMSTGENMGVTYMFSLGDQFRVGHLEVDVGEGDEHGEKGGRDVDDEERHLHHAHHAHEHHRHRCPQVVVQCVLV
jgi:hypothetical protein